MKVLLITPNFHQPRGNTVTVQRIADGLQKLNIQSEIISMTEESSDTALPESDIVHGFHAYRFYQFIKHMDRKIAPFIITITGTDLNHDLFNKNKREDVILSLTEAKAIHVFDEMAKQVLIREVPILENKIMVIPQGNSEFPNTYPPTQKENDTFLFFLPAGIRKVKNIPSAIEMLNPLHEKHPDIRLLLVGPIIEEEEGRLVNDLAEKNSEWIQYIGQVPHFKMGSIYKQADVILNTSYSEGQPSAIIEAMGYSLPVLVSDNLGNRSIVSHNKTGFIYKNQCEFLDYAEKLVNNKTLRTKLGQNGRKYIERHHSSEAEAEALRKIYEQILNEFSPNPLTIKG